MAADLGALELVMKSVIDTSPWQDDCDVVEIPWREEKVHTIRNRTCPPNEKDGKLVFGIMGCDGFVRPHPPVQRAIELVTRALVQQGYDVRIVSKSLLLYRLLDSRLLNGIHHHILKRFKYWYDQTPLNG